MITLKVDFVLNNSVGYRAAAIHASGKYLYAIDENDAVHDFCNKSASWAARTRNPRELWGANGLAPSIKTIVT